MASVLLGLAFVLQAGARTGGEIDRYYHHRIWQYEDGLPQNVVTAVIQTKDGYVWAATAKGFARFNGVELAVYDRENTPELKDASISCFCETRDGSLWIGTDSGGLNRLKNGVLSHISTSDGLSGNSVRALYETRDGTLWIATVQGVSTFKDEKVKKINRPMGVVRSFCESACGGLWMATSRGVILLKDNTLTRPYENLIKDQCRAILEDSQTNLWIGTDLGLIRIDQTNGITRYSPSQGLTARMVSALYQDRRGNLWIGTYGGLNRFANEKLYVEITSQGTAYDQVYGICEDKEGNIWVGTKEGLNRLCAKRCIAYTIQQGLSQNNTMAVLEDKSGYIWTTVWGGGLNRLQNEQFTSFLSGSQSNELKSDLLLALCQDHNGDLWIGSDWDAGLFRFHDGAFSRFKSRTVRVIHEDKQTNLWVGTDAGLDLYRNEKIGHWALQHGLAGNVVRAICDHNQGGIWIGTSDGLSLMQGRKFQNFTQNEGLLQNDVLCLYEDCQTNLWIGTRGGLNRYRDGWFRSYTSKEGLFADELLGILEDNTGHLWMSSRKGVFRVSKKDIEAVDSGALARIPCISYGKLDGMESVQCNGVAKPASWKAKDGRLWFTTTKGLVVIDPTKDTKPESPPPTVVIEKVIIDRRTIFSSSSRRSPSAGANFEVFPGRGELEIHYTALSFSNPEQNKFRYRLEGFDETWMDAGTRHAAYYSNLRPGRYQFQVIGSNNDGVWNLTGASFSFYLQPHFHQTTWFYMGCVLLAGIATLGIHRIRVRQLHRRQQELMALVHEKTANLQSTNTKLRQEIADREKAEIALQLSQEKVLRQEKLAVVGQLAAGVAHEFNNLLTVIQGHSALLLESHTNDADAVESLESISASATRAADLTRQMLAFSRKQIMRPQTLNLNALIGQLTRTITPLLTERITLVWYPAEDLPSVYADPGLIEQVLINLIVNARDAMPNGGKVNLSTGLAEIAPADVANRRTGTGESDLYPGKFVWFRLSDTGVGMDPATLKRVFEPFFTTKDVGKGTGLGLATVYGIVQQHNGWIEVESQPNHGSTFTVYLPGSEDLPRVT